jgi:phage terminase small subunit
MRKTNKFTKRAQKRRFVAQRPRLKNKEVTSAATIVRKGPSPESQQKDSDGLNARQRLFVAEYAIRSNGTDAAIRAGYSKHTAVTQGSTLLRNPNVARAVEKAQLRRLKRIDITGDRVLEELGKIAFSESDPTLPKPSEKIQALTTLARHLGLLVERHEVDNRMSILNLNVTAADLEDARRLVESTMRRGDAKLIEHEPKPDEGK